MRAISSFRLEAGQSSFWCRAWIALRMRASKSATGSVKLIFAHLLLSSPVCPGPAGEPAVTYYRSIWQLALSLSSRGRRSRKSQLPFANCFLPTRLHYPWNFTLQRQAAEAQTAQAELAQKRARPSANAAAVAVLGGKLAFLVRLRNLCCCSHFLDRAISS